MSLPRGNRVSSVLEKVASELKKRAEEIAQTLAMESGKSIKDARGNYEVLNRPVSMLSPWKFPLGLEAHEMAPAKAGGCPFVLKPAAGSPLSALILGEILHRIEELPQGAFSVFAVQVADMFTVEERLKNLTFTGSGPIGSEMKARTGRKTVNMEWSRNAPCVLDGLVPDLDY